MSGSKHISKKIENNVLHLGINRPEKKNALTMEMYSILTEAIKAAENNDEIRSVLLYGSTEAFTAGNDLKDFDNRGTDTNVKFPAELFLNAMHEFKKPVVAAVSGFAIGIGTTMLMHCDLVYASPDSKFSLPFINLGLVPEGASTILLPLNAGYKQAAELLMLGERFDAQTAVDIGVVTQIIDKNEIYEYSRQKAEELAGKPPKALLLTKKLLKKSLSSLVTDRIDEECRLFAQMLLTEESKEAREKLQNKKKRK